MHNIGQLGTRQTIATVLSRCECLATEPIGTAGICAAFVRVRMWKSVRVVRTLRNARL